jgi:signal transduction histidine kinase
MKILEDTRIPHNNGVEMDPDIQKEIGNNPTKSQKTGTAADATTSPDALKQALELAEKKLQIVGNVTRHDILNQLTAVMGYNELLSTMVQDKQQLHFLEAGQRACDKIRRILAYSKVFQNIGTGPARWQNIDMLVRFARDEVNPGTVAISTDAGTCSVYADLLFSNVLSYLFDNAVRHGEHTTEIRISVRSDGEGVILTVEDNGCGVELKEKEKIFERGFGKRTGWGLFVAREILAANGMAIRENGTAGKGACFEIRIPADRVRTGIDPPLH